MMPRANRRTAVLKTLIVWTAIAALPACSANAGAHRERANCPPASPPDGNIVYRPAYPVLRGRAFYLSNYAGVVYPPVRRGGALEPTMSRRRFSGWFAGHASHP